MTTYTFEEIATHGYKRGPCAVCGKTAERQQKFWNTLSPFNRNDDGTVRTRREVWDHVEELRKAWQVEPVVHARCEAARSSTTPRTPDA